MSRAEELFNLIISGGVSSIDDFIVNRQYEELFLDFKRSSDNGANRRLSNSDRKNFAKAISGFGNSEGGVIVWGVDCSNDIDGADVAKAKFPIKNPDLFASLLQGVISGSTVPPHDSVENKIVRKGDGEAYVITYIPKSNSAPHQSLIGKHYYIRAGSNFMPTPHDVLAGMFGKRPQPHVFHTWIAAKPLLIDSSIKISFGLALYNDGPGIAQDLFAVCTLMGLPGKNCDLKFDIPDQKNWDGMWEFDRQISLISNSGYRVPPGVRVQPVIINIIFSPPFDSDFHLKGRVGASDTRMYNFEMRSSPEVLKNEYSKAISSNETSKQDIHHDIAEIMIGIKS